MSDRDCMTCKYAQWDRTRSGRLDRSRGGKCTWVMPVIAIPKAISFGWGKGGEMPISQGHPYISRDPRYLLKDCAAWESL